MFVIKFWRVFRISFVYNVSFIFLSMQKFLYVVGKYKKEKKILIAQDVESFPFVWTFSEYRLVGRFAPSLPLPSLYHVIYRLAPACTSSKTSLLHILTSIWEESSRLCIALPRRIPLSTSLLPSTVLSFSLILQIPTCSAES